MRLLITRRGLMPSLDWKRIPERWLPFADAASADLPLSRLLRLSLFQVSVGMATALMVGTLNRVMIVELGVGAWLVALMVALPLVAAPFRAVGRLFPRSDRAPWIEPVAEKSLYRQIAAEPRLQSFAPDRTLRISSGFYTSQALELKRA